MMREKTVGLGHFFFEILNRTDKVATNRQVAAGSVQGLQCQGVRCPKLVFLPVSHPI